MQGCSHLPYTSLVLYSGQTARTTYYLPLYQRTLRFPDRQQGALREALVKVILELRSRLSGKAEAILTKNAFRALGGSWGLLDVR